MIKYISFDLWRFFKDIEKMCFNCGSDFVHGEGRCTGLCMKCGRDYKFGIRN